MCKKDKKCGKRRIDILAAAALLPASCLSLVAVRTSMALLDRFPPPPYHRALPFLSYMGLIIFVCSECALGVWIHKRRLYPKQVPGWLMCLLTVWIPIALSVAALWVLNQTGVL